MATTHSPTHRAIALTSKGNLGVIDVPTRNPGPTDVQFKVHYASYGSPDAHAVDDNFYVQGYPAIVGLASSGQVTKVGSEVSWLKEGDWVSKRSAASDVRLTLVPDCCIHSARRG